MPKRVNSFSFDKTELRGRFAGVMNSADDMGLTSGTLPSSRLFARSKIARAKPHQETDSPQVMWYKPDQLSVEPNLPARTPATTARVASASAIELVGAPSWSSTMLS